MAKVSPFKGWRYNPDIIDRIEDVFVPPYDVITPEEQDQYYNKSPHNYIRINLNNSPGNEKYFSAANTLNMWIGSGVLIEEDQPAIYIFSQSFTIDSSLVDRIGCVCSLELSELGETVLPHEQTIDKHLDDRYNLMESTSANSGQIFMCYKDEQMVLENLYNNIKNEPSISVTLDEVGYNVWPITDKDTIQKFVSMLDKKTLVIADGHHRYKTALKYAKNHKSQDSQQVMVTLVNSKNPGMQIMPTHRLLTNVDKSIENIKKDIGHFFSYKEFVGADKLLRAMKAMENQKCILGLYQKKSNTGLLLEFKSWDIIDKLMSEQSKSLRELDTNILHRFLLRDVFNIDTDKQDDLKHLSYLRGNKSVTDMLDKEENYDIVCFVNPPSLDDVFSIAEAGEVMPQKSTYFFPKVYSGLVTRCFNK
jgi:uncharacterized protein (DUF1015 family)